MELAQDLFLLGTLLFASLQFHHYTIYQIAVIP